MQFKNLTLTEFSFKNAEHYHLINRLEKTEGVKYISSHLSDFVEESVPNKKIIPGNTYVISNTSNDLVGLVGLKELDREGNLEMWFILSEYYRGKHYASKIVGMLVPYLVENTQGLNDVKLVIEKNNQASQRVALANGFHEVEKDENKKIYYYFKR